MRLAWFYVPNGIDMRHWTPGRRRSARTNCPDILAPLEPVKNDLLVLSNLTANWGRPLLVGAGDHGRALAAYMTGVQVYRTAGADLKLGVSADQIAANAIGHLDQAAVARNRPGRSRAWPATATTAIPAPTPTTFPGRPRRSRCRPSPIRAVCSSASSASDIVESPAAHARRLAMRQSILDQVMGDTQKLESNLGSTDRRKLDEYLTSVREIEQQVERAEKEGTVIDPGIEKPFGVPPEFPDYFRLMTDMMLVAFKADITRISHHHDRPRRLHARRIRKSASPTATIRSPITWATCRCSTRCGRSMLCT